MSYWYQCISDMNEYQSNPNYQLIWYNKHFKVGGRTVFYEKLFDSGIWCCNDLFKEGKIINFQMLHERGVETKEFMNWRKIISSIPPNIKQLSQNQNNNNMVYPSLEDENTQIKISNAREKEIKTFLNEKQLKSLQDADFKAKVKWQQLLGEMDYITWSNIYLLPHDILKCNKIKELQYKILYRYIGTNKFLYNIGKVTSPRCSFCELYMETLEHIFCECLEIKNFWIEFQQKINKGVDRRINLEKKDILLGYEINFGYSSSICKLINVFILHAKYYIYQCKINNTKPLFVNFIVKAQNTFKYIRYEEKFHCLIDQVLMA